MSKAEVSAITQLFIAALYRRINFKLLTSFFNAIIKVIIRILMFLLLLIPISHVMAAS